MMRKVKSLLVFIALMMTSVALFAGRNTVLLPELLTDRIVSIDQTCSGIFLTPSVIMTAHHCLPSLKLNHGISIMTKTNDLGDFGFKSFYIVDVVSFSKCSIDEESCSAQDSDNDLALIMGKFIDTDLFYKSLKLEFLAVNFKLPLIIENFNLVKTNTKFYFAGQGVNGVDSKYDSRSIRLGTMIYRGLKENSLSTLKFDPDLNNQVQCAGDSGGPVFNYDGHQISLFGLASTATFRRGLMMSLFQKRNASKDCIHTINNSEVSISHHYGEIVSAYNQWSKGLYYLKSDESDVLRNVLREKIKFNELPPPLRQ